jgi:valyl-tRNA synthetase
LKQDVIGSPRLISATAIDSVALPADTASSRDQTGNQMFAGVIGTVQVLIPLAGLVDIQALRAKLEKDLGKLGGEQQALNARLSNSKFVDKAPADVVQTVRDSLVEVEKQIQILQARLDLLA